MKICIHCNNLQPLDSFYAHSGMVDGHLNSCKKCQRARITTNRLRRISHYKEYDRQRANRPDRVAARKAYAKTTVGKAAFARARARWEKNNPEKRTAQVTLGNAVRDRKIKKPRTCPQCGATGRIHGHHEDYSQPLKVEWLCAKCHVCRHAGATV